MTRSNGFSIVYYTTNYLDPMAFLRIIGFAEVNGVSVIRGSVNGDIDIDKESEGELIILQRDYCRSLSIHEKLIQRARELHKPVVYDLDDLLFELPVDHPDRLNSYYAEALLPMLMAVMDADLVTVSTPALANYLQSFNSKIEVVPNYLVDTLWQLRQPVLVNNNEGKTTIGYMGGQSHQSDLEMILPALNEIIRKYQGKVHFHFWGIAPPEVLSPFSTFEFPSYHYDEFSSYFQQQKVDFFIAPLRDNLFNSCKSPIKFLEYSALGETGVFSKVTPYADVIKNGEDGMLAETMKDWVDAISHLIENPQACYAMALKSQEKVKRDWLLSKHGGEWFQLYERLLTKPSSQSRHQPSSYQLLKSIAGQTEGLLQNHDPQMNMLTQKLEEQRRVIERLKQEVASYSGSTSWRITEPFRIISNLFGKKS